jgi:hypothetical protein
VLIMALGVVLALIVLAQIVLHVKELSNPISGSP